MISLITFLIFVFVLIIGICVTNRKNEQPYYKDFAKSTRHEDLQISSTMKVNGVEIHLSDNEVRALKDKQKEKEYQQFKKACDKLIKQISSDREQTEDLIRQKVLDEILRHSITNQDEYNKVCFMYNDGKLRSNEEVEQYNKFIATVSQRENFEKERHKINTIAFFVPFITFTLIGVAAVDDWFVGIPIGLFIGCGAGFIGMMIGYSININKAKEYCIPNNDPRVQDEIRKRGVGVASAAISGVSLGQHAKNAIKEIATPDSWKEMK